MLTGMSCIQTREKDEDVVAVDRVFVCVSVCAQTNYDDDDDDWGR